MTRNLSHGVEVGFPVLDPDFRRELRRILDLQLADTCKTRVIDAEMSNQRLRSAAPTGTRAQVATRELLAEDSAIAARTDVEQLEEMA